MTVSIARHDHTASDLRSEAARSKLRGQGLDTALLRQELSYLTPEGVVGLLGLCRFQHLAKNSDQRFLGSRC